MREEACKVFYSARHQQDSGKQWKCVCVWGGLSWVVHHICSLQTHADTLSMPRSWNVVSYFCFSFISPGFIISTCTFADLMNFAPLRFYMNRTQYLKRASYKNCLPPVACVLERMEKLVLLFNPNKYRRRRDPVPMETLIVCAQSTVQVLEEVGRALISELKLDSRSQAANRNES